MARGFSNRARLKEKFRAAPKAVRRELQKELDRAGRDVSEAIRRRVPKDEGALAASVGYVFGNAPKTSATQAMRSSEDHGGDAELDLKVTVYEGNDEAFYAGFVEHGTRASTKGDRVGARNSDVKQNKTAGRVAQRTHPGTAAQPHFYPTWRAMKKGVKARLARAAKRGAQLAADGK